MWVLFTSNAKTKVVPDGRSLVASCPECLDDARFVEVEVQRSYGVFFLDLIDDHERKLRCTACGSLFELPEQPPAPPPPPRTAAQLAAERAALEARRARDADQRRELAEAKAVRIEDELAELKKRLGR